MNAEYVSQMFDAALGGKKREKAVDQKCLELAQRFVPNYYPDDRTIPTHKWKLLCADLAKTIQQAIDDWMGDEHDNI